MADYITEMANQIVAMSRRIDAIESDRVARMAELERMLVELQSGPHCVKAADVILLRKHHEALEQLVLRLDRESHADGFDKRIRELEDHRVFAVDREYDRQGRWHATRDAALNGYVHAGVTAEYSRDEVLKWANDFADRAHGPLEAKAENSDHEIGIADGYLMALDEKSREMTRLTDRIRWLEEDARLKSADVEALVKASSELASFVKARRIEGYKLAEYVAAAEAALKPFETERGE